MMLRMITNDVDDAAIGIIPENYFKIGSMRNKQQLPTAVFIELHSDHVLDPIQDWNPEGCVAQ